MKKRVSITALVLSAALVLGACGNSAGTETAPAEGTNEASESTAVQENAEAGDPVLKDGEMTEILVTFPGISSAPASLAEVEAAINEEVSKTMDAVIRLNVLEWGTYTDQTNLMLSSGEKMDLFFSYSGTKDYVNKGQLIPITG